MKRLLMTYEKLRKVFEVITIVLVMNLFRSLWIGQLVAKFKWDRSTAAWGVQLITAGAGWIFVAAFPYFSPFLLTLEGLIATVGTGAAIGW